jgi:hypothetical protein
VTEAEADLAIQRQDWAAAQGFVIGLLSAGTDELRLWLDRLERGAAGPAAGGDKVAQSVLGTSHVWRYLFLAGGRAALEESIGWFIRAARQEGGELMIHQVYHWSAHGSADGLHIGAAESFLAEPETIRRYRAYAGDPPWLPTARQS